MGLNPWVPSGQTSPRARRRLAAEPLCRCCVAGDKCVELSRAETGCIPPGRRAANGPTDQACDCLTLAAVYGRSRCTSQRVYGLIWLSLPRAAPPGREGADRGDPGGLYIQGIWTRSGDDLVKAIGMSSM